MLFPGTSSFQEGFLEEVSFKFKRNGKVGQRLLCILSWVHCSHEGNISISQRKKVCGQLLSIIPRISTTSKLNL